MVSHGALQRAYHRLRLPRHTPDLAPVSSAEATALNTCAVHVFGLRLRLGSRLRRTKHGCHLLLWPSEATYRGSKCHLIMIFPDTALRCRISGRQPQCVYGREYRAAYNASLRAPQQLSPLPASAPLPPAASGGRSAPSAAVEAQPLSVLPGSTTPAAAGCGGAMVTGSQPRAGQGRSARRRRNRLRPGAAGEGSR